ncbi:MAG: MBL fold metallo-hydrolase [Bacteroidales bacterium]|nr:MBL fold metallo-hydrolase [Bacteroidales bacterium]
MKVKILGTGTSQGVPVIACNCRVCQSTDPNDQRLRTSALVEINGVNIVIDAGPDFRQQMLREKVKDIDAILITHEHRDHIAGLDDVRAFNFMNQKPIDIYAEKRVQQVIKSEFFYSFEEKKYPGAPQINLHNLGMEPFKIKNVEIIPIQVFHYKLPVFGFRIGDFSYITDANYISEEEKEKLIGTKYLVVNALRKRKHISHFSLAESLELIKELSPKRAYITHISHQMGLHHDINEELPHGVSLAYDGLHFEV